MQLFTAKEFSNAGNDSFEPFHISKWQNLAISDVQKSHENW